MSDNSSFRESAAALGNLLSTNPVLRVVNFHSTPRSRYREYREQIVRLGKHFSAVSEADLDRYLATGQWHNAKPGVIPAIYEGYRNGYDVTVPLLEEFGLIGWFFVITDFVKTPPAEQLTFARAHDIGIERFEYPDGRYALSWNELREISRRHVVASHARSHVLLTSLAQAAQESEVVGSQHDFQEHLGRPVRTFVSYGGPEYGVHPATDKLIDQAGYQFVFSNLKIQRLREST
jgi:hypothetical protein